MTLLLSGKNPVADGARQAHETESEQELVGRLRDGDSDALATLMTQYANRLARFAYYIVGSPDAAEDVVQQTFIRVWEHRERLDPTSPIKAYLFRLVRNRALNDYSAESVRARYRTSVQQEAELGISASFIPSPEEHILTSAAFQSAIEQLPERRRFAIRLRVKEGMTHAEIGVVMGISPLAAQLLVSRAIQDLRKILWDV